MIVVILGCSAAGKSVIEKELEKLGYPHIISYTSRPIRSNETEDVDYHYISKEEFEKKKSEEFFAESTIYRGWYYGIAKIDCSDGHVCVVEPHGYAQIKKMFLNTISFFIDVPETIRLRRMIDRGDTDIMEMFRRLLSDQGTFSNIKEDCDYIINNNRPLQETVEEIINIISR